MSYLGTLLAQARGDAPSLRPVLPARFEPDAPVEIDAETQVPTETGAPIEYAPSSIRTTTDATPSRPSMPAVEHGRPVAAPRPSKMSEDGGPPPSRPTPSEMPAGPGEPGMWHVSPRSEARVEPPRVTTTAAGRGASRRAARPSADPPVPAPPTEPEPVASAPVALPRIVRSVVALEPALVAATTPALREPARRGEPTEIRVSIGRVDLRTPPAPAVRPAAAPWRPHLSLDEYLRGRSR